MITNFAFYIFVTPQIEFRKFPDDLRRHASPVETLVLANCHFCSNACFCNIFVKFEVCE